MRIFTQRLSFSSAFILLALTFFAVTTLISVGIWKRLYEEELARKRALLPVEAARVESLLTDAIKYTARYAEFVGEKIAQNNTGNLNYIAAILDGKFTTEAYDFYTTTFDWVTPDKQLRVSSKIGLLSEPFNMSDRDYLQKTQDIPWTAQSSSPRYGGLSKKWIIPFGMGITDAQGKFLGSITWGISVEALQQRLSDILGPTDTHYLILTENQGLVLDSARQNNGPADFSPPLEKVQAFPGGQYLAKPLTVGNISYTFYKKLEGYPFIILTGYSTDLATTVLRQILLSHVTGFAGISIAALFMLLVMRRRLVRPVMELAGLADQISRGKKVVIPESNIREIALMGMELQKIADYVQNERRITEELALKTQALEKANADALVACKEAQEANRAKSEFLANMSHELRTPMNAVIGLANILISKNYPPEQQNHFLHILKQSAEYLLTLINDLLDLARMESGQMQLENAEFELMDVVKEIYTINEVQAKQKNIALSIEQRTEPACAVIGDAFRLRQVLMNLVSNAIKFTPKGSVTIIVDGHPVSSGEFWNVKISVKDTGIGIQPEKQEIIFQKFTQADGSISRTHGGTGLGLSISKMLIERMGGKISMESTYGKGSCFTIELALPLARQERGMSNISRHAEPLPADSFHARILLVEDNSANVMVMSSLLDLHGYRYDVARDGNDALEMFRSNAYDLLLMDVQLPKKDGIETTRAIRIWEQSANTSAVPIIGLSANAFMEDKKNCLEAGMDAYVTKPFDPEEIIRLIRDKLSHRKTEKAKKAA